MLKIAAFLLIFNFSAFSQDELIPAESVPSETIYGSSLTLRPLEVWLDMINSAKKTLDIEQFYVESEKGKEMEPIIKAVRKKAREGVKVRAIFDKAMLKTSKKYLFLFKGKNMSYRIIDFKKIGGGVQHSKFFIVDGKEVYVGSQNFDWRSLSQIREFGFRIKSEKAAADFMKIFESDWAGAKNPKKDSFKEIKTDISCENPQKGVLLGKEVSYCLAFSPAGGKYPSEINEILKIINSAKKEISAQVMTYSDKKKFYELEEAFLYAAQREVKVRLIFSDWALGEKKDSALRKLCGKKNIEIKISSIPVSSRGFVPFSRVEHLKYLTADGDMLIASTSNWGKDYFYETRGAAVIIKGETAGLLGKDLFETAWKSPYVFDFECTKQYQAKRRE
ncbi:MAG: hypothetical protein GX447_00845 [Elusimicrobia bacterium]|nr:hypothetical protein [Elusimicrobiota bacterium]